VSAAAVTLTGCHVSARSCSITARELVEPAYPTAQHARALGHDTDANALSGRGARTVMACKLVRPGALPGADVGFALGVVIEYVGPWTTPWAFCAAPRT
jgi:hypothetical protein